MFWSISGLIFIRPFITSLAFPYLNLIYSQLLLLFLSGYLISKKRYFFKPGALIYPVIILIIAFVISLFFSQDKTNSLGELSKYISGLFLFLFAVSLSDNQEQALVKVVKIAAIAVGFLALYQYFFGFRHLWNYAAQKGIQSYLFADYLINKRVFVPFVTPGILGGYLSMIIPLFLIDKKRIWPILILLFALLLTKSLSAILSLFLGLIIYYYLRGIKKSRIFFLLGIFMLLVFIFVLRSSSSRQHTQPFFSLSMRLNYWLDTFKIIQTHPWVGLGPGNFNLDASRYAHNSYLQIWAELGVFGLLGFICTLFIIIRAFFSNLSRSISRNQEACLFACAAIFLIHNLLDFTFFLPEVVFTWWVILGLIARKGIKPSPE